MKRIICLLLCLVMGFSFAACGESKEEQRASLNKSLASVNEEIATLEDEIAEYEELYDEAFGTYYSYPSVGNSYELQASLDALYDKMLEFEKFIREAKSDLSDLEERKANIQAQLNELN